MRSTRKCISTRSDESNDEHVQQFNREGGKNREEIRISDAVNENKTKKNKTNKKENRFEQALELPTLANINPRSVYNKIDEFNTFVKEETIDVVFISESWERENLTLEKIIELDDHTVISKC